MREDDSNWFSRWEEQLPSPEELMPLSQTLISPDLALAFDIRSNPNPNPNTNTNTNTTSSPQHAPTPPPPPANSLPPATPTHPNSSADFADSADLGSGGGGGGGGPGDEPARTLKRPRLVWTPQLHKRFVDAVAHLGIKNAVPKTIMQLMSVDGLTRENVASHLQKYRLYLKRMQGLSAGTGGGGGGGGGSADPATDHLFASSPVPAHFLHPGRPNSDHFLPFVPVALQHHHHQQQQQQMAAAAAVAATHPQMQQPPQFHHHRQQQQQVGHFGSPPNPNGQFEHPFLARPSQAVHRMGAPVHSPAVPGYIEDMESANAIAATARRVLTLFPTGDD